MMEPKESEHLPQTLIQRMDHDTEHSTFGTWIKSYWSTAMPNSQPLAHPPLYSPLYEKEKSRFLLALDNRVLKAAIDKYLSEDPSCKFWQGFDADSCSWHHVVEELASAAAVYKEKAERNPLRRALRHGSGITRNIAPLLEGIPQENGVGLLKGAFKIIFHAVKRRSDTCEKIFDVFQGIPETILSAERYLQIHDHDESLLQCFGYLHYELAKSIPRLIDILLRRGNDSVIKKQFKTVFYDSVVEVDNILKPVKAAEERLLQCQRELDSRGIVTAANQSRIAVDKVDGVRQQITELDLNVEAHFHTAIENIRPSLQRLESFQQQTLEQNYALNNTILQSTLAFEERIVNSLYVMLQDTFRRDELRVTSLQQPKLLGISSRPVSPRHSNPQLRFSVSVTVCTDEERAAPAQDLHLVKRKYHDFSTKALAQANYLITTPRFATWLTDPNSDILLVDGHCRDQTIGKISPMSVLCAGLAETLRAALDVHADDQSPVSFSVQPRIALFFFAGYHASDSNILSGPQGLIRSLIDQLLTQWPYDDMPDIPLTRRGGGPESAFLDADTGFLCRTFQQLLGELGAEYPVCCILDGVSYFETSLWGWRDEMNEVLDCFLNVAWAQRERSDQVMVDGAGAMTAPVKFLLVSADRSASVRARLPGDCLVDLRAGNQGAGSLIFPGKGL